MRLVILGLLVWVLCALKVVEKKIETLSVHVVTMQIGMRYE